jgi:hypothetical protein
MLPTWVFSVLIRENIILCNKYTHVFYAFHAVHALTSNISTNIRPPRCIVYDIYQLCQFIVTYFNVQCHNTVNVLLSTLCTSAP